MLKAKRQQYIKKTWKKKHSEIFSYVYNDSAHSVFGTGQHRTSPMSQNNTLHTYHILYDWPAVISRKLLLKYMFCLCGQLPVADFNSINNNINNKKQQR